MDVLKNQKIGSKMLLIEGICFLILYTDDSLLLNVMVEDSILN